MITIFTIPKSFKGHINVIQRNAISSWLRLEPKPEIILLGDDQGVKETAQEFGVKHIPNIKKNKFGTPLLSSAFNIVQKIAQNNILGYLNTDIILLSDFIPVIKQINKPLFLLNGRRWDLDVKEEIDFNSSIWEREIGDRIKKEGKLHGYSGIDYFVFPKNLPHNLPDFAVGRVGWDNWLIYNIKKSKIPIIDATEVIKIIHQNHSFSHSRFGDEKKKRVEGPELKKNLELAGSFSNMLTIREADWILTSQGLKKPEFPRIIFSQLALFYPWRLLLLIKRKLQNLL